MNPLSPFVEGVLQNATAQSTTSLVNHLKSNPGQPNSLLFNCTANQEYVLKRFINACMAKDPIAKFNSLIGLKVVLTSEGLIQKASINKNNLRQFVIQASAFKKNQFKKNQAEGFATGRIIVFKALIEFFLKDIIAFDNISQILPDYVKYEQQIVQVLFLIIKDRKSLLKFKQLKLETERAILLRKAVLKQQKFLTSQILQKIIEDITHQYPKRSLFLQHLGTNLQHVLHKQTPAQLFASQAEKYFDQQAELNFKGIFYLLILFDNFLKTIVINRQNFSKFINLKMLTLWLQQLRVMNKKMKNQARHIQIAFDLADPDFCFQFLTNVHEKSVYLENISANHPLAALYSGVEPQKYYNYIVELINNSKKQQNMKKENQDSDSIQEQYYTQFQFFVRTRCSQLSAEKLSQAITILINYYAKQKKQSSLNLIWSLINSISIPKRKSKKSQQVSVQKNVTLIMKGIELDKIEGQQQFKKSFKKHLLLLRKKIKENQATQNNLQKTFYNFNIAVMLYSLVYQEQIEIVEEIKMLADDFLKLISQDQSKMSKPKKKVKNNKVHEQQDQKKPVRVMVDLMIGLLTKAPQFLRNNIETLFQGLIPYIDQEDLQNVIQVIGKPDDQYIQEI